MTTTNTFRGLLSPADAVRYFLAGGARVTLQNDLTGVRFTYTIKAPKTDTERGGRVADLTSPMRFVALADNERSYSYLGFIRDGGAYVHGHRKSRVGVAAPSVVMFAGVWETLRMGLSPDNISIWHEGICGRCGRTLTVPASIASGFGPDCAALLGIAQGEPAVEQDEPESNSTEVEPVSVNDVDAAAEHAIDAAMAARAIAGGSDVRATYVGVNQCRRCNGTGTFIGRNGRALGPCFACNGGSR